MLNVEGRLQELDAQAYSSYGMNMNYSNLDALSGRQTGS